MSGTDSAVGASWRPRFLKGLKARSTKYFGMASFVLAAGGALEYQWNLARGLWVLLVVIAFVLAVLGFVLDEPEPGAGAGAPARKQLPTNPTRGALKEDLADLHEWKGGNRPQKSAEQ